MYRALKKVGLIPEKCLAEQGQKQSNDCNDFPEHTNFQEGWIVGQEKYGVWRFYRLRLLLWDRKMKDVKGELKMRGFCVWVFFFFLNTGIKIYKGTVNKQQSDNRQFLKTTTQSSFFFLHLVSHQKFSQVESLSLPASSFLCDIMN